MYRYGQARTSPTPPLTHLRFDGILLCEADGRCRDKGATGTKKEAQAGQDNDTNPRHRARWKGALMSDEEQKPKGKGRGTRPRGQRIEVWVNNDEKAELADRAAQSGLSLSAYMKAAGLNAPIRARADLSAVADLVRVNGDLGRVAGLLKLWLAEKRGQGARPVDVEQMMIEFRELQAGIREKMSAIVFSRK